MSGKSEGRLPPVISISHTLLFYFYFFFHLFPELQLLRKKKGEMAGVVMETLVFKESLLNGKNGGGVREV